MRKGNPVKLVFGIIGSIFMTIGLLFLVVVAILHIYDPGTIKILGLIFGIIGVVFFFIGLVFMVVCIFAGNKKKKLLATGQKVYAEVTGGDYCYNVQVGRRHPFYLECKYVDPVTGATYLYRSETTWTDPTYYIGQSVDVYVDRENPKRYYVDVESLEKKVEIYDYR